MFFEKNYKNQELCYKCYEKDKSEYSIVKNYLLENNGATIMDIYYDTNVTIKTIERYIKEGKIEIIDE
ncbi:hypothetical protein [Maledivibacter halophilus]|nr:hypothetical protein [Maledivibacter halophilus]